MSRCPVEAMVALSAFHERIGTRPHAGFVVATTEPDPRDVSVTVQVSDVGCSPLCLISLANECLTIASERLSALSSAADVMELLAAVERARAALALASDVERVS